MTKINRHDTINLFTKLSLRRAWNGILVLSSYYISKWTRRPVQWGAPVSISFEPTTSCNLRCPECPCGTPVFYTSPGHAGNEFFPQDDRSDGSRITLSHFLFPGRTLSESGFPGDGVVCPFKENLYGHFHQCALI